MAKFNPNSVRPPKRGKAPKVPKMGNFGNKGKGRKVQY